MTANRELFDRMPERIFEGLREQMLLGVLSSEEVDELLGPCLEDYQAIMHRLPLHIRSDLESILRIYPEIASKYGIVPGPTPTAALNALWGRLKGAPRRSVGPAADPAFDERSGIEEDLAAEPQKALRPQSRLSSFRGKAYLTTDRGRGIAIEYSYDSDGETCPLLLRAPGLARPVHIVLCGRIALTLDYEKEDGYVDLEQLMTLFEPDEVPDLDMELREAEVP
jgi:hypothetical protein